MYGQIKQRKFDKKRMETFAKPKKTYELCRRKSPGGGMVDALVSGASAARRAGSSPVLGTDNAR